MFDGGEIIGGPLKRADGGKGGKIESSRGIEQNDGVKEERLKVTERSRGDITLEKHSQASTYPPNSPLTRDQELSIQRLMK